MRVSIPSLPVLRQVVQALLCQETSDLRISQQPDQTWIVDVPPAAAAAALSQAVHTATDPSRTSLCAKLRAQAKASYEKEGELEFDDDAPVSLAEENEGRGAYVQAWCWIDKRGEYICTVCQNQWFAFELRHRSASPAPQNPEERQSSRCPACGGPLDPVPGTPSRYPHPHLQPPALPGRLDSAGTRPRSLSPGSRGTHAAPRRGARKKEPPRC